MARVLNQTHYSPSQPLPPTVGPHPSLMDPTRPVCVTNRQSISPQLHSPGVMIDEDWSPSDASVTDDWQLSSSPNSLYLHALLNDDDDACWDVEDDDSHDLIGPSTTHDISSSTPSWECEEMFGFEFNSPVADNEDLIDVSEHHYSDDSNDGSDSDDDFEQDNMELWAVAENEITRLCGDEEVEVPFWFGHEDDAQLALIDRVYAHALGMDNPNPRCDSRRLPVFIGRIERVPVTRRAGVTDWISLDRVEVFQRDSRPLGARMTALITRTFLSSWELEDGALLRVVPIPDSLWQRIRRCYSVGGSSFVNRLPVWQAPGEYKSYVESTSRVIGWALEPFHYGQYLPSYLRTSTNLRT